MFGQDKENDKNSSLKCVVVFSLYQIKEMLGIHLTDDVKHPTGIIAQEQEIGGDELWECFHQTDKKFMVYYPSSWKLSNSPDYLAVIRRISEVKTEKYIQGIMTVSVSIDVVEKEKAMSMADFADKNRNDSDQYDVFHSSDNEAVAAGVSINRKIPFESHCFDMGSEALCLRADYYGSGSDLEKDKIPR
ncbi:MAG: hypothetical protein Athens071425_655 [Parcubacteria group bacterium Athens0714_25]|nr:MAG: hypothetical protein Athens071425_655 [Parcubacteria group bacterium Athens0714_25]